MKPRLLVHIGTPKTGTSTIQQALLENRALLRTDCKMLLPSTERNGSKINTRHMSVVHAVKGNAREQEVEYRALMHEFERSGMSGMVLTNEEFSTASPNAVHSFFRRFANDFDIEVICYLRRQDYYAESLYNQALRKRRYKGIPPISDFWRDQEVLTRLDMYRMLCSWRDLPAKVIAKDFKKEIKYPGLMPSFLQAARLVQLGEIKATDRNISPDVRLLLTLCLLSEGRNEVDHVKLQQGLARAAERMEEMGVFNKVKQCLGRTERRALLEHMAPGNELLAKEFGIKFSDEMPEEADAPLVEPDAGYLMGLIGELSLMDSLRFMRSCQGYVLARAARMPEYKRVRMGIDETMLPEYEAPAEGSMLGRLDEDDVKPRRAA